MQSERDVHKDVGIEAYLGLGWRIEKSIQLVRCSLQIDSRLCADDVRKNESALQTR